ncbi:glutaredoxin family protein [Tasmannia lanceolata]|uniref:glutaredoxin family protein n=1 Tax=Tasmannia lanceolata TaxID=3420 RepID=UPI0040639F40
MWPRWGKSPRRNPSPVSSSFNLPTFKDVYNLCKEENESQPQQQPNKPSSIFHRVRIAATTLRHWNSLPSILDSPQLGSSNLDSHRVNSPLLDSPQLDSETKTILPEKRIVVYFTSLRVVRKTFEDCNTVRSILKGFRVSIDERDLSMDAGFLQELQGILGIKKLTLPRVFIGGRYFGGADEIRQLNETGELKKIVDGLPLVGPGVCQGCGGLRFVLCDTCHGSHKCYFEKGGFRVCTVCNENGLIRCPDCR